MVDSGSRPAGSAERRRAAEERLAKAEPGTSVALDAFELRGLLHELQVHQVELEMQNVELQQARDEIATLLDGYADLYDFAPVGYLSLDARGVVLKANLTAVDLLGVERSSLVGMAFPTMLRPESRGPFADYLAGRFHGLEGATCCDLACLDHPGRAAWIRLEAFRGIVAQECRVALIDISERKQEEAARRRLEAELIRARKLEAIATLSSGVAHNINNVLAAIMLAADTREALAASAEERKAAQAILEACRRGRDVVKALVYFAHPDLLEAAPVDLHDLLAGLGRLLGSTHPRQIRIVQEFCPEPLWVSGSAGALGNAFMDLCLNAVDALPGSGTLTLRTTSPEENWICVSVEDDGDGMTPEVLEKAIEPFFTTKDVGKGAGLGLSVAYGIVKAHGGALSISSQPGRGTVVTVRIPRIPAPVQAAAATPAPVRKLLSLLLVDDDEDVRMLAARMFKAGGLKADCVEGGREALDHLRSHALPDLVILDQNMPGMDGVQTLRAIRALHPHLPILISSGHPDLQDWDCFKLPHVGILPKPFDLAELKAKLPSLGLIPGGRVS